MLRLIVMRHAKSSWKSGAPSDHERPLNKRGKRDAPKVGAHLQALGWVPQVVLSSDSLRTQQTSSGLCDGFGAVPVQLLPSLYHGGIDEIRAAVGGLEGTVQTAMVLGHNPGWEDAVQWLSGVEVVMKTGCAALLECDGGGTWPIAVAEPQGWLLRSMVRPRELG